MAISFQNATNGSGISYTGKSWSAAWTDFDKDGYPDLWVNNHQDAGNLYLNQGDGTFIDITSSAFPIPENGDTHTSAWADFDEDGDLDLVQVIDGGRVSIQIYVNEGGILVNRVNNLLIDNPEGFLARGVFWFDYNNDELLDIVINAAPWNNRGTASTVFRQTADNRFEYQEIDSVFDAPLVKTTPSGIVSDLTGDGNFELIIKERSSPFVVYQTGSTPLQNITNSLFPNLPSGNNRDINSDLISADFNGDLRPDLYLTQTFKGLSDFGLVDNNSGRAKFFVNNKEEGVRFKTDGNVTFDILGQGGLRVNGFQDVPLDSIFIGANGINPNDTEFTLSKNNSNNQGILDREPGVDSGIYIGYNSANEEWEVRFSSPNRSQQGILFDSTQAISEINAIRFDRNLSNIPDQLFINTGNGFSDRSQASGLNNSISGANAVAGDFDNDMDIDLYVVTTGSAANRENILYENQGDGTFVTVPNAGGAEGSSLGLGASVTTADYDLDGFLDLFVTNGDWPAIGLIGENPGVLNSGANTFDDGPYEVFRNPGNNNHWLQIDLVGTTSNIGGIGAKVLATAGGVTQLREQGGGFHSKSQNHQRVHFGLGNNNRVSELEIKWSSDVLQILSDIDGDEIITVTEGIGLDGDDSITGSDARDILIGNEGDDILRGERGNDIISGDDGDDRLFGNNGNDTIRGESGRDFIRGGNNDDELFGVGGNDLIYGERGNDLVNGGGGQDRLSGNQGDDELRGLGGNDLLNGGIGSDTLFGGAGNDALIGNLGNDTLTGESGRDRFLFSEPNDGTDTITDFSLADDDVIQVRVRGFGSGLRRGVLPNNRFVLGNTAQDNGDRFIYNQNSGNLMYDSDGTGNNNPIMLAVLSNQVALSASDIVVV